MNVLGASVVVVEGGGGGGVVVVVVGRVQHLPSRYTLSTAMSP